MVTKWILSEPKEMLGLSRDSSPLFQTLDNPSEKLEGREGKVRFDPQKWIYYKQNHIEEMQGEKGKQHPNLHCSSDVLTLLLPTPLPGIHFVTVPCLLTPNISSCITVPISAVHPNLPFPDYSIFINSIAWRALNSVPNPHFHICQQFICWPLILITHHLSLLFNYSLPPSRGI